jgi:two-component system sensor histidine kinase PilS (NtrC family)
MDIILRESQRLDQAIRDFLTFARPGRFAPEKTDVVRLLRESVKLLTKSREFRPTHEVETDFEAERIEAEVDVNRMKQVFWNLATNALKAMPDGGRLRIAVREVRRDRIEVSFEDDGRGMDDTEVAKYFQPFQSAFGEGTGLGAAIVYRLVEEHGGRIHLDSVPDKGTSVRIVIPRRQPRRPETADDGRRVAVAGGRS